MRKKIVYVLYFFAGALFFAWGGIYDYWNGRLPTVPDESTGSVYPINFHGTDGYATGTQIIIYYSIPVFSIVLAILVMTIDYWLGRMSRRSHSDCNHVRMATWRYLMETAE